MCFSRKSSSKISSVQANGKEISDLNYQLFTSKTDIPWPFLAKKIKMLPQFIMENQTQENVHQRNTRQQRHRSGPSLVVEVKWDGALYLEEDDIIILNYTNISFTSSELFNIMDQNLPQIKIIVVGDPGVGQSSILFRFVND